MISEEFLSLTPQRQLERTQTNVTHDPNEALQYARYVFDHNDDPVIQGTAARQYAFLAERAKRSNEVVATWFARSYAILAGSNPALSRERIATHLLDGRATALRIERSGIRDPELIRHASNTHQRGEEILLAQHVPGDFWDRYGTMLAVFRAAHEAMNGDAALAKQVAASGIWRALTAQPEGYDEAAGGREKARVLTKHGRFVAKHAWHNSLAGGLAVSRPKENVLLIQKARHKVALSLFG